MKKNKIIVIGLGYVGLSLAILLAQKNSVIALDIDKNKIDKINAGISPIKDKEIEEYLESEDLDLKSNLVSNILYNESDFIIISTPTNYDELENNFDTSSIDKILYDFNQQGIKSIIVIKSTIPIGYMKKVSKDYPNLNLLFSPEFLREGKALYDNLHPSRIIVGTDLENNYLVEKANQFIKLLSDGALDNNIPTLVVGYSEAESIKLFANTYLALRISYFNELDTYAKTHNLDAKSIIEGVSYDPRIGDYYNNPSFGYGGYCLPKDTKQLLSNYESVPQNLIESTINSNVTRKNFIVNQVLDIISDDTNKKVIGIYRLTMKKDSDNYRESSIFAIMEQLSNQDIEIIIYEPTIKESKYSNFNVISDINDFKNKSDLIIANRIENELLDIMDKVYTRDLYFRD